MEFVAFAWTLIAFFSVFSTPALSAYLQPNPDHCQFEGQKIANQDFDNKLFLCHYYPLTKSWLLYPFTCVARHRFVPDAQRCLIFEVIPHSQAPAIFAFQEFFDEGKFTEVPDPIQPTPKNSQAEKKMLNQNASFRSVASKPKPKPKSEGDLCGESLRSLSGTIAALSRTIEKLSGKVVSREPARAVPPNATINVKMPNFPSFAEFLQFPSKYQTFEPHTPIVATIKTDDRAGDKNEIKPVANPATASDKEHFLTFVKRPLVPTLSTTVPPSPFPPDFVESSVPHPSAMVRPQGTGLMDFLFKNLLTPSQALRPSPPQLQVPKIPFEINASRPQSQSVFKPIIPFRRRPPPHQYFNPFRATTPASTSEPETPRPPTFVNMLSLLKTINEANPFKIEDSDEDEGTSEEWNDIAEIFGPVTKKPVATVTSAPHLSSTTIITVPPLNETGSTSVLTSTPSQILTRSSDFREFDNNDDEAEEEDEAMRLNNRKPR